MRLGLCLRFAAVAAIAALALLPSLWPQSVDAAAVEASAEFQVRLDPGVAADEALDGVYRRTGAALMRRDPAPLADCYADDAIYISADVDIMRGRKNIADGFQRYFAFLEEKGGRVIESAARVVAREKAGDLAYDVGYWRITTQMPGQEPAVTVWKYSNVFRRGADGQWQLQVDTNMPAKVEAFAG